MAPAECAQRAGARRERVSERRNAVQVAMTGAIDTPARTPAEVDRLLDDLNDGMDVQDDDAFAGQRPLGAILWTACQALDLSVDLTVWEHEDWADQEIVQRPEGSPSAPTASPAGPQGSPGPTPNRAAARAFPSLSDAGRLMSPFSSPLEGSASRYQREMMGAPAENQLSRQAGAPIPRFAGTSPRGGREELAAHPPPFRQPGRA